MGQREAKVERHLQHRIKRLGGECLKWTSPGNAGVPDRLVIIHGKVIAVEVKTYNGRLSHVQARMLERLSLAGMYVQVVFGREGVDAFVDGLDA